MTTKIGINGFGRIGRQVLKRIFEQEPGVFDVVAINDLFPTETNAHLFKYDSNYGQFKGEVAVDGKDLIVNGDTRSKSATSLTVSKSGKSSSLTFFFFLFVSSAIYLHFYLY